MVGYSPVAQIEDLVEGRARAFDVNGTGIVLCKKAGEVFAFEGQCSHAFKSLEGARARGDSLMCPHHGARFDLRTGAVAAAPAVRALKTYSVRLAGTVIEVKMEE